MNLVSVYTLFYTILKITVTIGVVMVERCDNISAEILLNVSILEFCTHGGKTSICYVS